MPGNYKRAAIKNPPVDGDVLWCPIPGCVWHLIDSWSARRRMGEHVANTHPKDVIYSNGEVPEDLPEVRV
jgi:hypothetical protein